MIASRLCPVLRTSALCFLLACGAKTDLPIPEFNSDAGCSQNWECDDGFGCTSDLCVLGECRHRTDDSLCETGLFCSIGACSLASGCTSIPRDCSDAVACTVDSCSEDGCVHEPNDELCPVSTFCDIERGCVGQLLVHDENRIYRVELDGANATPIATSTINFTDLALGLDRTLYGCDLDRIYEVDLPSGIARPRIGAPDLVALEIAPDGVLYGAGLRDRVIAFDLERLEAREVARLPDGYVAAGDIAFVEGRMLITGVDVPASTVRPNVLIEVDLASGTSRILGDIEIPCVWGVAAFGPRLFGFTCNGVLYEIDPFSGEADRLDSLPFRVGGAAAR